MYPSHFSQNSLGVSGQCMFKHRIPKYVPGNFIGSVPVVATEGTSL